MTRSALDNTLRTKAVLIITRHYAPEPTGSAPVVQSLAEWLTLAGYATRVVTSRPSYPEGRITAGYESGQHDRAIENGVEVLRWPTSPVTGSSLLSRAIPEARFMLQLWFARLRGSLSPSAMLISLCPSILTVLGALAFRRDGGRHIAIVHDIQSGLGSALGSLPVRSIMRLLSRVETFTLNRVDNIIVLSEAMAKTLRDGGIRTEITILPPQVDCHAIMPDVKVSGRPSTLLYSGNLGRKQGLNQVLDMAAILLRRAPEVSLIIRGEGSMKETIASRIAADGLSNTRLLPLVSRSEISRSLAEGDVHLVPQLAEGGDFALPSKAFAIMAAGRPFVTTASANSTIGLMAKHSGAFICVPPGDPTAFADAILSLLADPQLCATMGQRGRRFAEETADTPVVMRRIAALLESESA